jgi:hypothetical protein
VMCLMMALQKQLSPEDQQNEEEAASGGMPARCSDLCDPQKHVSSKVCSQGTSRLE